MSTVTRDTVLLAGDETDEAVARALGLDAIPFEGMTVGDLVDDVNRYRGNLERLICAVTGGAMSKAGWAEDTDVVVEAGAPVAMRVFVCEYPSLFDCEPFRAAVDQWFGPELLAGMKSDRRPLFVGTGP